MHVRCKIIPSQAMSSLETSFLEQVTINPEQGCGILPFVKSSYCNHASANP